MRDRLISILACLFVWWSDTGVEEHYLIASLNEKSMVIIYAIGKNHFSQVFIGPSVIVSASLVRHT